ncbi:LLM class flavin-dependent oxidoreductase [Propionibacteriaceae bacterium G1746]|uniref:LLM class flavin-dependent oxidoreductase n=1 Tax=Aestuariimicrobium sp. G57 TaxID=3418485 RepID=UPI003C232442
MTENQPPANPEHEPAANRPLRRLGVLTLGTFDGDNPAAGHEYTLTLIEHLEALGYDSVWLRHRHFQHGISSPIAVMAAASQRTSRIELGTAVTPLGAENPLRLAEDLATVDVLSGGRINPGISTGAPMNYENFAHALYPDTAEHEDFSYRRVERLIEALRGDALSTFSGRKGIEEFSDRVQPHSPGLVDRVWYGAGSQNSVEFAAKAGLNFLTSSVIMGEGDFDDVQAAQIRAFRSLHKDGDKARVSQGLVVIPTDSATPEQVERYRAYKAERDQRVGKTFGPKHAQFAPDLLGTSEELAEQLLARDAFRQVEEVAFALPFTLQPSDYDQIVNDIATELAPRLGWAPSGER